MSPRSRVPKKTAGIEWIGGTVAMPGYVTGEGEPYRPEALFWMSADGAILGSKVAKPGELLPMASESLRSTIKQPMHGRPHRPTRVRVASAALADILRTGHPGLDVVCASTPELTEMVALMREKMDEDGALEQSYLSPAITPEAMASFFKAAAALFCAKPPMHAPSCALNPPPLRPSLAAAYRTRQSTVSRLCEPVRLGSATGGRCPMFRVSSRETCQRPKARGC